MKEKVPSSVFVNGAQVASRMPLSIELKEVYHGPPILDEVGGPGTDSPGLPVDKIGNWLFD